MDTEQSTVYVGEGMMIFITKAIHIGEQVKGISLLLIKLFITISYVGSSMVSARKSHRIIGSQWELGILEVNKFNLLLDACTYQRLNLQLSYWNKEKSVIY